MSMIEREVRLLQHTDLVAEGMDLTQILESHTTIEKGLLKTQEVNFTAVVDGREKRKELLKSGNLSETGLDKEMETYIQNERQRLDSFGLPKVDAAKERQATLDAKLKSMPEDTGDPAKAIEIRAALASMSDTEVMTVLEESLAAGERDVGHAIFSAPVFIQRRILPITDFRAEFRRRFQEATEPAMATEARELRQMIRQTENSMATAKRHLLALIGKKDTSDIATLIAASA